MSWQARNRRRHRTWASRPRHRGCGYRL